MIAALFDTFNGVQVETTHPRTASVASDTVFGEDRRDVFGEFLGVESDCK